MSTVRHAVLIGGLGALIGFAVNGPLVALAGAVIGVLATLRPRFPAAAAVSLLVVTAFVTLSERTLDGAFGQFTLTRPLTNWSARFVSVTWGVAVALGWIARGRGNRWSHTDSDRGVESDPVPQPVADSVPGPVAGLDPAPLETGEASRSGNAAAVIVIGVVVACVSLFTIGDGVWTSSIVPIAIVGLVVSLGLLLVSRMGSRWSGLLDAVPGRSPVPVAGRADGVVNGSLWMLAGTAALSIGSFVFWVTAARVASRDAVGEAAALFSVVTFLNYATSLGLPIALTRFGRTDHRSSVLFTASLLVTTASSIVGVGVFALFAPDTVESALRHTSGLGWATLVVNTIGMSVSVLVDVRCMTLRLWSWVFWRSVAIAVIRLPFLAFAGEGDSTLLLFNLVIGGYTVTGFVVLALLVVRRKERLRLHPPLEDVAQLTRFAGVNYLGQLAIQGPFFAVPLIALSVLDADANASFYLAWGIMSVVVISIQIVGQVLLVEGDREEDDGDQARVALAVGVSVGVVAFAAVALLRPVVGAVYGDGYEDVPDLLLVMVAGAVPYAVTVVAINRARIRSDHRTTLAISLGFFALVLTPALVLIRGNGAAGAAWAWSVGNAAAAGVAVALGLGRGWRQGGRRTGPVLELELEPVGVGEKGASANDEYGAAVTAAGSWEEGDR